MAAPTKIDLASLGAPRDLSSLLAHERFAIFGASAGAAEVEALLRDHGREVVCYYDNNAARHDTEFRGRTIRAPKTAIDFAKSGGAIIIAAAYQIEIATQLQHELGIAPAQIFPFISRMFAPHFGRSAIEPNLAAIESLLPRLADDASRRYVKNLVRFRWTMNPLDLEKNPHLIGFYNYDRADLRPRTGDHIIDCGAYTGDTAKVFLDRLGGEATVTAIEPLSRNYDALRRWVAESNLEQRVDLIRAAVGAERGEASIAASEDPADPRAHVMQGQGEIVPVDTLDRIFKNRYRKIDFIKIDIEGMELDALAGARALIAEGVPRLAIAGYHKPEHLWQIPQYLDRIRPGYAIYAGHHPSAIYECEFFCTGARHDAAAA
jgi:FkbM family methyltransferase